MSVESSFSFDGFKIDQLKLECQPDLRVLLANSLSHHTWDVTLSIRQPIFMSEAKKYVCGINAHLKVFDKSVSSSTETKAQPLASLEAGIAGAFSVRERMEASIEERLVKVQMPALLFPYLRAAITGVVSSAGLGVAILPLVNVQKLAEDLLGNTPIQIVD